MLSKLVSKVCNKSIFIYAAIQEETFDSEDYADFVKAMLTTGWTVGALATVGKLAITTNTAVFRPRIWKRAEILERFFTVDEVIAEVAKATVNRLEELS